MDFKDTLYNDTNTLKERKSNERAFDKRRLYNMFYCLTNYSSASIFDVKSISDMFKYYNEILNEKYGTSTNFQNSIKNSVACFNDPSKLTSEIDKLKNDQADSFIIMPSFAKIHTLANVIRKQDDQIKFYKVDKFTSHFNSIGQKVPHFTEYVIKKNDTPKLISELLDNDFVGTSGDISDILKKHSEKVYSLIPKGREQKVFTCLFKEPETGIKFAFATRNLSTADLKLFRQENEFSKNFKVKWGLGENDTIDIHSRLLNKIKEHNPMHNFDELDKVFKNYVDNKQLRRLLRNGTPFSQALSNVFDPEGKLNNLTDAAKTRILIKNINFDTVHQIPQLRNKIFKQSGITALHYFEKSKFDTSLIGTYANVFSNNDFNNIMKSLDNQEKYMPIFVKQAKEYYALVNVVVGHALFQMYVNESKDKSVKNIKKESFDYILKKVGDANKIAPYADKGQFAEGVFHLNKGIMMEKNNMQNYQEEFSKALKCIDRTVALNPNFAEARYVKAVAHKKLNMYDMAQKEFNSASNLGLLISDSKNSFNKKLQFNFLTKDLMEELSEIKKTPRMTKTYEFNSLPC